MSLGLHGHCTSHPTGDLVGVASAAQALVLRGENLMPDTSCYSSRECCQSLSSANREWFPIDAPTQVFEKQSLSCQNFHSSCVAKTFTFAYKTVPGFLQGGNGFGICKAAFTSTQAWKRSRDKHLHFYFAAAVPKWSFTSTGMASVCTWWLCWGNCTSFINAGFQAISRAVGLSGAELTDFGGNF